MSEGNDGNGFAKSILDNEQVFQLFMSAIDERVVTRLRERSERNRIWVAGLVAAIATLAAAGVTIATYVFDLQTKVTVFEARAVATDSITRVAETTKAAIEEDVARQVVAAVQKELKTTFADTQFNSQLAALNFRVLSIDLAEGIRKEESESITSEIEALYSQQPDTESRNKLRFAVETAAKNFVQIDRPELVFRLEMVAPEIFENSGDISQAMIQLLGNRLLADVDAPGSWKSDEGFMTETHKSYRRFAERAKNTGFPELHLAYEMLLRFVERGSREQILNLIEDTRSLSSLDAEHFETLMVRLAKGEVGITGSDRVATRTKEFLCRYRDESELLFDVSETVELQCS